MAHPVRPETYKEINNFYTATVYEKGAEVVRMVQTLIGAEKFRAGMDLYFARHDGEAATVEQFIQCFADASSRDLTQFMRWYSQAGTPQVTVAGRFDADAKTYTLECKQSLPPTPGQPNKEPMVIPLNLGLVGKDGRDLPLASVKGASLEHGVLVLDRPAETVTFPGIAERPVLSINRGFSAPIRLETNLSGDDLAFLAAHDGDPFNRWQALQTISMRLLIDNVARLRAGKSPRGDDKLILALAALLEDAALEPAFVALALVPPGDGDIAREIGRDIDPDAIFRARKALRAEIGERLGPALSTLYERMTGHGGYTPDAKGAGRRALRNVGLDLMAATARPETIARAARQYQSADNMTDRIAALGTLSLHDVPERAEAFADFYGRYSADALDHRQVVLAAGHDPAIRHARESARADRPSRLLACQSQPRARADRRLLGGQPHAVQPRRRRRLRFHRRDRAGARSEKSAGIGAACHHLPHLAHAGRRPPRQGGSRAQAHQSGGGTVPRPRRHRRARARRALKACQSRFLPRAQPPAAVTRCVACRIRG